MQHLASPAVARPSCQTLGLVCAVETQLLETRPLLVRFSLRCKHRSGALNSSLTPFERAARPLAVGEPVRVSRNIANARVGCPSFGGQLTTEQSRKSTECRLSRHRVFGELGFNATGKRSLFFHSCNLSSLQTPR